MTRTITLGVVALCLSVVAVVLLPFEGAALFVSLPVAIAGLACGVVSVNRGEPRQWRAVTGIVLSSVAILVVFLAVAGLA